MNKTFNCGKIDYNRIGKRNCEVTIEVSLKNNKEGLPVFTASGNIWNHIKSDVYSCGQNLDKIVEYIQYPKVMEIYRLWKLYHLNDLNPGTPEQEQFVKTYLKETGLSYDYNDVCDALKNAKLYEVIHEGKPYKYGHGWIYRPIPDDDLNKIKELLD